MRSSGPAPICFGEPGERGEHGPFGHVDEVTSTSEGLRIRGWAIDPDTDRPINVQLRVDGRVPARKEVIADLDRPDVGARQPGFGSAHGFDVTLEPPRRHISVCVIGVNIGQGESTRVGCGREQRSVPVLTLSVGSWEDWWTNDNGQGKSYIAWRDRYRRVTRWMATTGTLPDFVALQEMPAIKWWPFPVAHPDPLPYEALDVLMQHIKGLTGASYRIAYHSAVVTRQPGLHQGRALIYNADRVRNTTAAVTTGPLVPMLDTTTTGGHLRASYPCRQPCPLLDGDGRHWVAAHINTNTGRWEVGAAAAVFEFIAEPGKHIIVHNVHQVPAGACRRSSEAQPRSR